MEPQCLHPLPSWLEQGDESNNIAASNHVGLLDTLASHSHDVHVVLKPGVDNDRFDSRWLAVSVQALFISAPSTRAQPGLNQGAPPCIEEPPHVDQRVENLSIPFGSLDLAAGLRRCKFNPQSPSECARDKAPAWHRVDPIWTTLDTLDAGPGRHHLAL